MTLLVRAFSIAVLFISGLLLVDEPIAAQPNLSMEQAIAAAERFVRENGYADVPAEETKTQLEPLEIELLEFLDAQELLRLRRNTVQPKAIGARATSSGWGIAFDAFTPQADVCVVVEMRRDGSDIRVMHQSGIREFWVGFKQE